VTSAPGGSTMADLTASASAPGAAGTGAAVGVVTNATGASGAMAGAQSARGTVEGAQAAAIDPRGAATAEADSRVTGAVGAEAPVDVGAVQQDAQFASMATSNPEAAAASRVDVGVDTQSGAGGAGVSVHGSASAPPIDPTKK
jgi:hypothetical protein